MTWKRFIYVNKLTWKYNIIMLMTWKCLFYNNWIWIECCIHNGSEETMNWLCTIKRKYVLLIIRLGKLFALLWLWITFVFPFLLLKKTMKIFHNKEICQIAFFSFSFEQNIFVMQQWMIFFYFDRNVL